MPSPDVWRRLLINLDYERPPLDMSLYVKPKRSPADRICWQFRSRPTGRPRKFLLIGGRGGGKSTELHAVARELAKDTTVVGVDLDASGINAANVSAFDLLYISSLALLRVIEKDLGAKKLFDSLAEAYGQDERAGLGDFRSAVGGVASFVASVLDVGSNLMSLAGTGALASVAAGAATTTLTLRQNKAIVAETSPSGRGLLAAAQQIAHAVRDHTKRPLCVMIDGLEKMNGRAEERFREVFDYTRLLLDTEWGAVIAAPPTTLSTAHSAALLGFVNQPVWGFGPDDLAALRSLLSRRIEGAQQDPAQLVDADGLDRIVDASGGHPRDAVAMLNNAVDSAFRRDAPRVSLDDVSGGIRERARDLAFGLDAKDLDSLESVRGLGVLPGDERAPALFANGRILALPPSDESDTPHFIPHPLLLRTLDHRKKEQPLP